MTELRERWKRRRSVLLVLVVAAIGLALSWSLASRDGTPIAIRDTEAHQSARSGEGKLAAADVARCAEMLRKEREVVVAKSRSSEDTVGSEISLRSHGVLPPDIKGQLANLLTRSVAGVRRQMAEIATNGSPDLEAEARLAEALQVRLVEASMLQADEYVLLDIGAVHSIWPSSPPGYRIVTLDTIELPGGVAVDVVFPIEISKHKALAASVESRANVRELSSAEAAYRFNGLPDELRAECAAIPDPRTGASEQRQELRSALLLLDQAGLGGWRLDRSRLIVEPPR